MANYIYLLLKIINFSTHFCLMFKYILFSSEFCTEWPKGLETDEDCERHFPVEIITSDYCHSAPIIRDERSRIVTLKVKFVPRFIRVSYISFSINLLLNLGSLIVMRVVKFLFLIKNRLLYLEMIDLLVALKFLVVYHLTLIPK